MTVYVEVCLQVQPSMCATEENKNAQISTMKLNVTFLKEQRKKTKSIVVHMPTENFEMKCTWTEFFCNWNFPRKEESHNLGKRNRAMVG